MSVVLPLWHSPTLHRLSASQGLFSSSLSVSPLPPRYPPHSPCLQHPDFRRWSSRRQPGAPCHQCLCPSAGVPAAVLPARVLRCSWCNSAADRIVPSQWIFGCGRGVPRPSRVAMAGRHGVRLAAVALCLLASAAIAQPPTPEAGHFRGGSLAWTSLGGNTVEFEILSSWRRSHNGHYLHGSPAMGQIFIGDEVSDPGSPSLVLGSSLNTLDALWTGAFVRSPVLNVFHEKPLTDAVLASPARLSPDTCKVYNETMPFISHTGVFGNRKPELQVRQTERSKRWTSEGCGNCSS